MLLLGDEGGAELRAKLHKAQAEEVCRDLTQTYQAEVAKRAKEKRVYTLAADTLRAQLEEAAREKAGLAARVQELEATIQAQEGQISGLTAAVSAEKAESSQAREEAQKLREELATQPKVLIDQFLGSQAFQVAAMTSCTDMIRAFVYWQLQQLGRLYPFTPEQLGYVRATEDAVLPRTLPGYSWDRKGDRLLDPAGVPQELDITVPTGTATGIQHEWLDVAEWPVNVYEPNWEGRRAREVATAEAPVNVEGNEGDGR